MHRAETGPQPQPRDRLTEARIARDWSQRDLAERIGTTYVNVSRWERGITKPTPYFRRKLCQLFGKTEQELGLVGLEASPTEEQQYKTVTSEKIADTKTTLPAHGDEESDAAVPVAAGQDSASGVVIDFAMPARLGNRLVGRGPEIFFIRQQLLENVPLVALSGLPGVGKTSLSIALAYDERVRHHFRDGILWAGLGPDPDIPVVLRHWGTLLGLAESEMAALGNYGDWARALHAAIGARSMLLVIDDVWNEEQALTFKVGGPNCSHLVTTRFPTIATQIAVDSASAVAIKELSQVESVTLLSNLAPVVVQHEPDIVDDLVQAVGGLPLALTIMGNYLRRHTHDAQPRRIRNVLSQLSNAGVRLRLSEQRGPVERHTSLSGDTDVNLQSIISVTERQLVPSTRAALYALSVFPPKPNTFSEEAALVVTASAPEELDALTDAGLLESSGSGRYTLHQVIADYARARLSDETAYDRTQLSGTIAYARLLSYVIDFVTAHTTDSTDYEQLDQEHPIILAALEAAHEHTLPRELVSLIIAYAPFLLVRGLYPLADRHLERAYTAAETWQDTAGLTDILLYRGETALKLGNYAQAERYFQSGLTLARQAADTRRLCALLTDLGGVNWNKGEYSQAERYLQEGLILAQNLGDRAKMTALLKSLGLVAASRGDYMKEKEYLQEGLTLARQIEDREQMCVLLMNLGATTAEQGDYTQAETYFQEGLAYARQIGHRDRISALLSNLGGIAIEQGHYDQAIIYLQDGLLIVQQTGNKEWLSFLLYNLGLATRKQGHFLLAEQYLRDGLKIAQEIGTPLIIANVLYEYGNLYLDQKNITFANDTFLRVQETIREGDQELVALSQYGLARVAAEQQNMDEARRLGAMSVASLEAIGHRNTGEVKRWLDSINS